MSKVGRGADQISLRLPDGMRDALKAAAEANGRSVNTEVVQRLQDSLTMDEAPRGQRYVEMPDDVSAEVLGNAIGEAMQRATHLVLARMGLKTTSHAPERFGNEGDEE